MKRLYLLRHAKADHTKEVEDEARLLSKTGVAYCGKLAKHLQAENYIPDYIITSDAIRAKDTATHIANGIDYGKNIIEEHGLYLASPGEMIARINELEEDCNSLMVVGHNPGVHQLTIVLAGDCVGDTLDKASKSFPPGACAVFDLDIESWDELEPALGRLVDFIDGK